MTILGDIKRALGGAGKRRRSRHRNPGRSRRFFWLRIGDQGEYEHFDTPWDAGNELGTVIEGIGWADRLPAAGALEWIPRGLFVGPFQDDDYVSAYWGDKDAQPTARPHPTGTEKGAFQRGFYEGIDS